MEIIITTSSSSSSHAGGPGCMVAAWPLSELENESIGGWLHRKMLLSRINGANTKIKWNRSV